MIPHSLRRNATGGSTIGAAEAGGPASERARTRAHRDGDADRAYSDARSAYARMLALVVMVLCPAVPRSRLEPMLVRLRSICDHLASSDRTAQRWFSWALRRALSQGEPAPWRALQAAEACLRDARLAGDRFVEQFGIMSCGGGSSATLQPKPGCAVSCRIRTTLRGHRGRWQRLHAFSRISAICRRWRQLDAATRVPVALRNWRDPGMRSRRYE